jgi:hypothetical protein
MALDSSDIITEIVTHIDTARDYLACMLVSSSWHNACMRATIPHGTGSVAKISQFYNHLEMLIKKFPDKSWCWVSVFYNPNITWAMGDALYNAGLLQHVSMGMFSYRMHIDTIIKHRHFPWDWKKVSQNPTVSLDIIMANLTLPWKWKWLTRHPNITIAMIESTPAPWLRDEIVYNPNVSFDYIIANRQLEWDWHELSQRAPFAVVDSNPGLPWAWGILSTTIPCDVILSNQHLPWDYREIYNNPSLTIKMVGAHGCLWNDNMFLWGNWELIRSNPTARWNWFSISQSKYIDFEYVLEYPDRPYVWNLLSLNSHLTFGIILRRPGLPWNWRSLSMHRNITFEMIMSRPDLPWDWAYVSENPSITLDIVVARPDFPWAWDGLSRNLFNYYAKNKY